MPLSGQVSRSGNTLKYTGSSTVGNFISDALDVYKLDSFILDTRPESAGGELAILEGRTDLAGIARLPSEELLNRGIASTLIGWDAIAIIVHPDNPLKNLTQSQLKGIFTGQIKNWNELHGDDLEIHPYIVGIESATRKVCRSIILGREDYADCTEISPDIDILDRVANDPGGIGQISFSFIKPDTDVEAIDVNGQTLSLSNNNYPITRPLYLLWWPGRKDVASFVNWTQTREGQRIVMKRFIGTNEASVQVNDENGSLIVYTETYTVEDGGMFYYPHNPYDILDADREVIMTVNNHLGKNDENPTTIELQPGNYLISLKNTDGSTEEIFAAVEAGKTTRVFANRNVQTKNEAEEISEKPAASLMGALKDNSQLFTAYGDFRVRGEQDNRPSNSRFRGRFRIRAGMSTKLSNDAKFDLRLVSTTDPNDPNSSHVNLNDGFNQIQVAIDRAYFHLHPQKYSFVQWWLGKFGNPNISSNIYSELVWDADIQPEGTAISLEHGVWSDKVNIRFTNGSYLLSQFSEGNRKNWLNMSQLVFRTNISADWNLTLASNFYYYANIKDLEIGDSFLDANEGNSTYEKNTTIDGEEISSFHYATDFHIMEHFALLRYDRFKMPLILKFQCVNNLAAEENNRGIIWGLSYGDLKKKNQWKIYYQYHKIYQDAVFTPYAQDDALSKSNSIGHIFGLAYNFHRLISIHAWGLLDSPIEGETGNQSRIRVELNVKF